jgi:hypothetical protein
MPRIFTILARNIIRPGYISRLIDEYNLLIQNETKNSYVKTGRALFLRLKAA